METHSHSEGGHVFTLNVQCLGCWWARGTHNLVLPGLWVLPTNSTQVVLLDICISNSVSGAAYFGWGVCLLRQWKMLDPWGFKNAVLPALQLSLVTTSLFVVAPSSIPAWGNRNVADGEHSSVCFMTLYNLPSTISFLYSRFRTPSLQFQSD